MEHNAGKPMPQVYLVSEGGEGYRRVSQLVIPAEGETPPGQPVTRYHTGVPPSPKR
jgi:hypothetical protein